MRKIILLLAINILHVSIIFGQYSLFQDKAGQSSIILNNKNNVNLNTGNASISGSYLKNSVNTNNIEKFIGIVLSCKANNGVTEILQGYTFKPQFNLNIYLGKSIKLIARHSNPDTSGNIEYAYIGAKFTNSYFNLLNKDSSYSFASKAFYGYKFTIGYNIISHFGTLPFLIGTSLNFELINNQQDLSTVETYLTSSHFVGNNTTTLQKNMKTGYSGDYFTTSAILYYLDAYAYPEILKQHRIGFGGYLRSQLTGQAPRNNLGAGLVLGQKGSPTNIVLGFFYQFNDIFNQLDKQNDFLKRGGVNLIAGYNF